jgi:hypothetical protein
LVAQNDDPANFLMHMQHAEEARPSVSNQVVLADYYRSKEQWHECHTACQEALARVGQRPGVGHWGDDERLTRVLMLGDGMNFCTPTFWLAATASAAHLMMLRPMWTTSAVT